LPQSQFDGVRLRLQNFLRIQWAIFVAGTQGCPKRVFHWSAAWPSWQLLWWGVISFQNFRSLKLKTLALFLHGFPCFKWINRVYRFDGFLWNLAKMFLGYQCEKGCETFLIFKILLLLHALMWQRSANIQFANFKIDFLCKQSEYQKSLTPFCSLSPTDWHCAVCLVLLVSRKAGNSVIQIVSVLHLKACALTIKSNV